MIILVQCQCCMIIVVIFCILNVSKQEMMIGCEFLQYPPSVGIGLTKNKSFKSKYKDPESHLGLPCLRDHS